MPRALLSVSDKTGIVEFARKLTELGYEIISTGGTQKALQEEGIAVTGVEDVTGFPECFSGRVKTMHPLIMGGVLYRRDDPEHCKQAEELNVQPIDLIAVNLYPFQETAADESKNRAEVIEQIDIGGPTMLRSAAKNYNDVTVICDAEDYGRVIAELEENGETSLELREELAVKVFERTTTYDAAIVTYLSGGKVRGMVAKNGIELRYGENPHQKGYYYDAYDKPRSWRVIQEEKQMSYLNLLDADGAWDAVEEFSEPTVVMVKHANPCGIASDESIEEAFQKAYDADRLSAFGVIIALNRPCTDAIVEKIIEQKIFAEILIAPGYTEEAIELLKKKKNLRVIEKSQSPNGTLHMNSRSVLGGVLIQDKDMKTVTEDDLTCVTETKPTKEQIADLLFAWKSVKHCKSNAIVFAKDLVTVGIGCGQTSRVDATWIAAKRAGDKAHGAVMASDAFFPFPDSVEEAAQHGIAAIIQPGGSIRDDEVIAKANELGVAMVVTGIRAFKH